MDKTIVSTNQDYDDYIIEIPILTDENSIIKVREMFDYLGISWIVWSTSWFRIITNNSFLALLFMDHVRLQIKDSNCGIPYYHYVRRYIGFMDQENIVNYIHNQWKNPTYTKEYTEVRI